ITCGKGDRFITVAASTGILSPFAFFSWRVESALILSYSVLLLAASLYCLKRDKGKANGDYSAFSENDYDRNWFDFVIENIGDYPVLFPPDIRSRKGDYLSGRIADVGMGLRNKYQGIAVAGIEADSGFYLCPLSSLVPGKSVKIRGSVKIAARTGKNPCTVTFYRYEYGGHTVVSGAKGLPGAP
ncbi:MAG: hypothetical protein LBL19_00635, partial [Spirochaetaceae bacterium]|nr:hypothetical protein [Spirochaetaceae bacterium]